MSGCPQEVDRWSCHGSRAVTWAGLFVAPALCLFFLSVFHIFWNPDLRCVYLYLSHMCFVSLNFWGICKVSDKSEITPICQWDSLHASWLLNCVSFYIFRIRTLIGHKNCQFVIHLMLHFSIYLWLPIVRLSCLMYSHLCTFPFISFAFGITPNFHCQDWCTGTQ